MGLFGKRKLEKKARNVVLGDNYADFLTSIPEMRENEALKLSAVFGAISTISNTMSKIPFSVINRFTKEKVDDVNLYNLLNLQPNANINIVDAHKNMWIRDLYLGEAFCVPIRKYRSNEIDRIEYIENKYVSKSKDDNGVVWYTISKNNDKQVKLRYDEIIHIKEFTLNGIDGVSPLEYARHVVQTGLNQTIFEKAFYQNYGRPNDYLKTATDLSTKKIKRTRVGSDGKAEEYEISLKQAVKEEWNKTHSGENLYSTAILDNGLEYGTVPQITPEQMQFVNAKSLTVEDIARFFDMGNCLHKLGLGKQTYSTNEQGQISYVTETIVPRLRKWETELTLKLLTKEQRDKGLVIKGNINAELRGDTTNRASWYDKMRSMGVYNINEIRELEDLPSIGEDGETRLIGANSIPLERLLAGESTSEVIQEAQETPQKEPEVKIEENEEKGE